MWRRATRIAEFQVLWAAPTTCGAKLRRLAARGSDAWQGVTGAEKVRASREGRMKRLWWGEATRPLIRAA